MASHIEIGEVASIPFAAVEKIATALEVEVDEVQARIDGILRGKPIGLGRGAPHPSIVNTPLIRQARADFHEAEEPLELATYVNPHKVPDDPNAFRGDRRYLDHILRYWAEELDIEDLSYENIISGSAGGQAINTVVLDHFANNGALIVTPSLVYDRVLEHVKKYNYDSDSIRIGSDGFNLGMVKDIFQQNRRRGVALYLVFPGGNPDGSNLPMEQLVAICQSAEDNNGVVVVDGAYAELHFDEEDRVDWKPLEPFIHSGALIITRTSTKEGGKRDAAYAVGSKQHIDAITKPAHNRRLSPDYEIQVRQQLVEGYTEADLEKLELEGVRTFQEFLAQNVRPHLALNFATIKTILTEANIKLSNKDLTHGYNVAVYFPMDTTDKQSSQFFQKLKEMGIDSPDLSAFSAGHDRKGFRIPFGGFTCEECKLFSLLIVEAYQAIFYGASQWCVG